LSDYKHPTKLLFEVDDTDRPLSRLLNEAIIQAEWGVSPELNALFEKHEFTQRGRTSWAISTRNNGGKIRAWLKEYVDNFLPNTLVSSMEMGREVDFDYDAAWRSYNRYMAGTNHTALQGTRFLRVLEGIQDFTMPQFKKDRDYDALGAAYHRSGDRFKKYFSLGAVAVEIKKDILWVRLVPAESIKKFGNIIKLPRETGAGYTTPVALQPRKVVKLLKDLSFLPTEAVIDERSDDVLPLLEQTKKVITVGYAPNEPATVQICRGENVEVGRTSRLSKYKVNVESKIPLSDVLNLQTKNKKIDFVIHEGLTDIVNMVNSEPYEGEPRLREYQKEAVGLHLATKIGYLQTCSPGMGKTVIQLTAMRVKATQKAAYRGLVVCEANVRTQWSEEAEKWFPEAKVFVLRKGTDDEALIEALSSTEPVIIIMSYSHTLLANEIKENRKAIADELATMKFADKMKALQDAPVEELTVGSMLLDSKWDDICADEAMIIRNGSSKQAQILWDLRKNSSVATALTATPINKSPNDIGRLIAWVRNDKNLFTGQPLDERYDTTSVSGATKLFKIFGPLVFRRDISEIADELPEAKPSVMLLKPSPAEKALVNAAERELKRCYLELVAALEEIEQTNKADKEDIAKAKEQLRAANGAWLGGTQLARMATSDPSALLSSESTGAALLAGQGLIQAAMAEEPTKRAEFMRQVQERIARGEQVVAFTEFATVATTLVQVLQDNGINAKAYTGKNGTTRDRARKEFQEGQLDVLVCTQAGERGLTLHKAAAIYHYDLPWTLEKIIQRTGRGIRIGSENKTCEIVFLVMEGTVEQRMASRLVQLGVSSSLVLDNSRGIDLKQTDTANAMGGLITVMSSKSDSKNLIDFGKMLLEDVAA
jgi:superfamily II DNA or RNA helicase